VIAARFRRDRKIGAEERRAQFGDQFLGCIALVAPPLPTEFAGEARGMASPMRLMPISA